MKNFFFKKALPNSTSFDSTLNAQINNINLRNHHESSNNNNNSIDKPTTQRCTKRPTTLAPTAGGGGTSFGTSQQCHQIQTPSSFEHQQFPQQSAHQRVSPMSCSSTQGTIGGCAVGNELFEQNHQSSWHLVPFDSVQLPTTAQCHRQQSMHNCRQPLLMLPHMSAPATSYSTGQQQQQQQQMPDFVGSLVQQLSTKDAEIERLRTALRRSREATERERERHAEEESAAREQISRMRRRLRTYETELEYAKRLNRQQPTATATSDHEAMAVAKCEQLIHDNNKMKTELAQQQRSVAEREAAWDRERAELNQTVRSLNNTLEELEMELRQREVHGREMQLQLERTVVERDMAQAELLNKDQQHNQQRRQKKERASQLSTPNGMKSDDGTTVEHSNTTTNVADGGEDPSLASSSGIDSNCSVSTDIKELDTKCLWMARRKLVECRQKVARLVKSAEKTLRDERLGRDDLFSSFLSVHDEHQQMLPISATQMQLIDEQITQIGALRKEMELLHDKFVILYARGTFGK